MRWHFFTIARLQNGRIMRMVTNAAMQMPRTRSDSFSLLPSPFKRLGLASVASMMMLVCRSGRSRTMARPWMAQG